MKRSSMKNVLLLVAALTVLIFSGPVQAQSLSEEAQECVDCHANHMPAMVIDWKSSKHAENGISCMDCHVVDADSPMGAKHPGLDARVSVLVPRAT